MAGMGSRCLDIGQAHFLQGQFSASQQVWSIMFLSYGNTTIILGDKAGDPEQAR